MFQNLETTIEKSASMLAINEQVGRIITLINLEKDIFPQKSIEQEVANLVDLLKIRVQDKSVEAAANSVLEPVFDLRFSLLEWLGEQDKGMNDYLEGFAKHISVNLQLSPYSNLAKTVATVMFALEQITSPLLNAHPNLLENARAEIQQKKPDYDTLKSFALHPSPQIQYVKKWIDASLQIEVGLILSDLVLTNQIEFPKERVKTELIDFLMTTIVRYGAYSVFTGFWTPANDDLSTLTNRMKILSATIELDNNLFQETSKEGFFNLVNN